MKGCILKPIIWNTNNYISPSGYPCQSGYPKDYGFGHEEWNNDKRMVWRGWRVFHTELREKLLTYSKNGELLILMTAMNRQGQHAVGIAAGVYHNSESEMKIIAKDLGRINIKTELWNVPNVQKRFGTEVKFSEFWKNNHEYIQWRCVQENYHWFDRPILLNPLIISGKKSLSFMYGSYQAVPVTTISRIVEGHLPSNNPIWAWLAEGKFDPDFVPKGIRDWVKGQKPSKTLIQKRKSSKSNSATKQSFEYWVHGIRTAEPHHAILQSKFVYFLKSKGIKPIEDKNFIDVQYFSKSGKKVYAEIKPTTNVETKYAIRAAIGQLLEYRYKHDTSAEMIIVIGNEPTIDEVNFVKSLGMSIAYLDPNGTTFKQA